MYAIYPLRRHLRNFYACCLSFIEDGDVYFSNICIIRMFYCFNWSRALHKTLLYY